VPRGLRGGSSALDYYGSQHSADGFQTEPRFLGTEPSPAFVRSPEDNGCGERFIRILKGNLL
jgi:hypothetical protein